MTKSKLTLDDSIDKIKGIGPRYLKCFQKLSVETVRDLLYYFPFRYQDFSKVKNINELVEGETVSIIGVVKKIALRRTWRKKCF